MPIMEEIAELLSRFFNWLGSFRDIGVFFETMWNNFIARFQ